MFQVTRSRLRDSLHRHNTSGIADRQRGRLHRREYCVSGPNILWHIDTNHKLIRWHFIIVGGIDGFSRLITFLQCTNNNRADTLLQIFVEGSRKFGLPLRLRCDQGLENKRIAEYMVNRRGLQSVIAGKSVHNQRIERLWRDVFEGVLGYFYELFHFMEDEGVLNILNEKHLYALHYVYFSKINAKLDIWREAWARHRIRTVHASPICLWTAGQVNNTLPGPVGDSNHEITDSDAEATNHVTNHVDTRPVLDEPTFQLSALQRQQLEQQCPPEWDWASSNSGIDVYMKAVHIIIN